jgi:hypothetical protein
MVAVDASLRCLVEPIDSREAELLHRVHGLDAISTGDDAVPYLWASAPTPRELQIPEGAEFADLGAHQLAIELWPQPSEHDLPPAATGGMRVNGLSGRSASDDAPYVLQRLDLRGVPAQTAYVHAGAAPPAYPKLRRRLALAGGATALAASGALLGAQRVHDDLLNPDLSAPQPSADELTRARRTNNGLVVTSATLAAASAISFTWLGATYVW